MCRHFLLVLLSLSLLGAAAWIGHTGADKPSTARWVQVAPGILRSAGLPCSYALVDGQSALVIDAAASADGLQALGVEKVEAVLLTHHHRDTAAFAECYLADKVPVRAPKTSADWLKPDSVAKYWKTSLPLRNSKTAYLVLPEGLAAVDCSLQDGQAIEWKSWNIQIVATPGHSRDHVAYAVRKGKEGPL